jgi:hypothetical protein
LIDDRDSRGLARRLGKRVVRIDRSTHVEYPEHEQHDDRQDDCEFDKALASLAPRAV